MEKEIIRHGEARAIGALAAGIVQRLENCVPDQFGNLGDYCVSEGFKSVCSVGNPAGYTRGGILPATSRPMRRAVECQKSWQNLHSVWMFDGSLFALSWSTWCACNFAVPPQASQEAFRCFLARHEYPCAVRTFLVFAHESEQNRRLLKAVKSSNRAPKRLRDMIVPQASQSFDCSLTRFMAQTPSDISVQECGKPIRASTHRGFSAPTCPVTVRASFNELLKPLPDASSVVGERPPFQSLAVGVGQSFTALDKRSCTFAPVFFEYRLPPLRSMLSGFGSRPCAVSGVGHNPDTVPAVMGTNGASWYAVPFRIVPERGQGSENVSKPSTKQSCDVFQDDVSGFQFANQTGDFVEQAAAFTGKPGPKSCEADVLTREAPADDIDGNSIGSKSFCGEGSHVVIAGDIWPVFGKDATGELFNFTERDGFEAIDLCSFKHGALQSEREATYSRETDRGLSAFQPSTLHLLSDFDMPIRLRHPFQVFGAIVRLVAVKVIDLRLVLRVFDKRFRYKSMDKMLRPYAFNPKLDAVITRFPDLVLNPTTETRTNLAVLADRVTTEQVKDAQLAWKNRAQANRGAI